MAPCTPGCFGGSCRCLRTLPRRPLRQSAGNPMASTKCAGSDTPSTRAVAAQVLGEEPSSRPAPWGLAGWWAWCALASGGARLRMALHMRQAERASARFLKRAWCATHCAPA